MSGVSQESTPTTTDQTAVEETPSLPFATLGGPEFALICSGPRISSLHNYPRTYYGPVTIRMSANKLWSYTRTSLTFFRKLHHRLYEESLAFVQIEICVKLCPSLPRITSRVTASCTRLF